MCVQPFRQRLSHTYVKTNATMPISVMGMPYIVWCSLIEVNSVSGRNSINKRACALSFYQVEMPLASIKQPLASIFHNTIELCSFCLYIFVVQPFLKHL